MTREQLQSLDVLRIFSGLAQKRVAQRVKPSVWIEFPCELLHLLVLGRESVAAEW